MPEGVRGMAMAALQADSMGKGERIAAICFKIVP